MKKNILLAIVWGLSLPALFGQPKLDSLFSAGLQAEQAYRYQDALNLFFECQRNDPQHPEYLSHTGYCYFQLGNLTEARVYLNAALKQRPSHLPTLNYLASIEEQLLDYKNALVHVRTLISLDSSNSYYHRQAGQLCEHLNQSGDALQYYQSALQLNPYDQSSLIPFCRIVSEGGHPAYADSLLNLALQRQPDNLRLLYESAKLNYLLKRYEEVLPRFEKALSLQDTSLLYLPLLGYSLAQLGRCEEAIPWLEHLLKHKEPNEQLHYFTGFCYLQLDSLEKSMAQYELAIQAGLSPNLGTYHEHLGSIFSKKNQYRAALKNYETAQEYGNKSPTVYFHMATALDQLQKKDKKRPLELYKKYLSLYDGKDPSFKAYAENRVQEIEHYEKHIWKGH